MEGGAKHTVVVGISKVIVVQLITKSVGVESAPISGEAGTRRVLRQSSSVSKKQQLQGKQKQHWHCDQVMKGPGASWIYKRRSYCYSWYENYFAAK